jgi:hypothetical protein
MMKPKNIAISAIVGFVLSFLISIIATHRFFRSLLRGGIFAVIFALLAIGIAYLYGKFLEDEAGSDLQSSASPKKADKVGSVIDLTVSDENLTDDGQGPQFFVANNKHTLAAEDTAAAEQKATDVAPKVVAEERSSADDGDAIQTATPVEANGSDSNAGEQVFQSIDLGKPFSEKEAESSATEGTAKKEEESLSNEEIDELPDIGNLESDNSKEPSEDKEIIKDSDFAVAGKQKKSSNAEFPDGSNAKNHDAETMAKAIRTLLKKDE